MRRDQTDSALDDLRGGAEMFIRVNARREDGGTVAAGRVQYVAASPRGEVGSEVGDQVAIRLQTDSVEIGDIVVILSRRAAFDLRQKLDDELLVTEE